MNVLFLDVNGVLNNHADQSIHRDKTELLNQIILKSKAKIVLTSSFRYLVLNREMTIESLDYLFQTHGVIPKTIIDTIGRDGVDNSRGSLILNWLEASREPIEAFAILDDCPEHVGLNSVYEYLVRVDGDHGLVQSNVDKAVELLKNPPLPLPFANHYEHSN